METGKIQLKSFIDKLKVTDTHEHFFEMTHPGRRGLDLFRLIGDAYVCGDIFCAGADFKLLFETPVSAGKKWQELRKILPAVKTTSYYRYLDDMFKNLYEVKQGLTDSTWQELNEKISAKGTDRAWVADVVTKRSGIENILLDRYWDPLLKNAEFNFIRPIFRINIYVMGTHGDIDGDGNRLFSVYPGLKQKVKDLDSYLAFIESCVANAKKNGYVGLKSALAYDRTLYYEDVPKGEASKIYKMKRSSMTSVQKKKLEDYLFHYFMQLAEKYELPVQIHTGMHAGFDKSIIDNSDPGKLNNIFLKFRNVKFDIFHAGYPFHSKLMVLAKNFKNVNFDLCWMPIISSFMAGQILNEALDTLPNTKIFWGGDCAHPEHTFGAVRMGKNVVYDVLSSRMEKGIMDLDTAKMVAENIFYNNAKRFYRL